MDADEALADGCRHVQQGDPVPAVRDPAHATSLFLHDFFVISSLFLHYSFIIPSLFLVVSSLFPRYSSSFLVIPLLFLILHPSITTLSSLTSSLCLIVSLSWLSRRPRYYSGDGKGHYGCLAHVPYRRALCYMVRLEDTKDFTFPFAPFILCPAPKVPLYAVPYLPSTPRDISRHHALTVNCGVITMLYDIMLSPLTAV